MSDSDKTHSSDLWNCEPVHTDPPFVPDSTAYETHRPGEWIILTDAVYSDVIRGMVLEDYHPTVVALETGKLWIHIETAWKGFQKT